MRVVLNLLGGMVLALLGFFWWFFGRLIEAGKIGRRATPIERAVMRTALFATALVVVSFVLLAIWQLTTHGYLVVAVACAVCLALGMRSFREHVKDLAANHPSEDAGSDDAPP